MARVSRILLPVVLTGIVLLSDLSWLESSNKNRSTDNAVGLASASTPTPTQTQKPESSAPASPVAEQKTPDEKSPSIIQMLEGREHDLILWVSIAIHRLCYRLDSRGTLLLAPRSCSQQKVAFLVPGE